MNLRASAIVMKGLPATALGDALLISREEARRIGYELEQAAKRIEALERELGAQMSKHTPGPWTTYLNTMEDIVIRKMNAGGYEEQCIARHVSHKNASLIAAAPELLEALKDARSALRYIREVHGELYGVGFDRVETNSTAAIAKADEVMK